MVVKADAAILRRLTEAVAEAVAVVVVLSQVRMQEVVAQQVETMVVRDITELRSAAEVEAVQAQSEATQAHKLAMAATV